jgi:hypothetical protein
MKVVQHAPSFHSKSQMTERISAAQAYISTTQAYISTHTFKPYVSSNGMSNAYGMYGLNSFGGSSIIEYKESIWMFIWFKNSSDIARYVNAAGDIFEFNTYNGHDELITRMIEA